MQLFVYVSVVCVCVSSMCVCVRVHQSTYLWITITYIIFAVTETHFPNGRFSMSAFTRLKVLTGIDIVNELDIHTLVQLILNMPNSCAEVFEEWLAGQSPLAPTWENLMQVLKSIDMEDMAEHIEQFFRSKSVKKELEKKLVPSLHQYQSKVEKDLHKQMELLKLEYELLKTENEILNTEIEVLRQQLNQLPSMKPTGK